MNLSIALLAAAVALLQTADDESPRLLPALLRAEPASAFQVSGGVSRPAVRSSDVSMQLFGKKKESQFKGRTALDDRGTGKDGGVEERKRFMLSGRKLTQKELDRKAKIVDSANFPPRTMPIKGEGYFFFQGPSPKTAVQKKK